MRKAKLSIIIPVFNEESTIRSVVESVNTVVLPYWAKEVIIIDDGSTDNTAETVKSLLLKHKNARLIRLEKNSGKGTAVIRGIKAAKGEYILIQDADLEYNPRQIPLLLLPIQQNKAHVVYGTRLRRLPNLKRDENTPRFLIHYLGNRLLSFLVSALYGQWLTDIETGYKVFPKNSVKRLRLTSRGFEFEPEITVQLMKHGYRIHEVPIKTTPRGYDKGKKLRTIPDGIKALMTILKMR